jgi:hypothetical protein
MISNSAKLHMPSGPLGRMQVSHAHETFFAHIDLSFFKLFHGLTIY